jgi:AraC-like DNA-binding protein
MTQITGHEGEEVDNVPRPAFSMITEHTFVGETQPHQHRKAQLLYVISGLTTVEAAGGVWTVPPRCALWIPGGISHWGRATGPIKICSLYVEPNLTKINHNKCGILFVQPFLRELLLRFDTQSSLEQIDGEREARLLAVLLDELEAAPLEPIHLPLPTDKRLRRLVETMLENPAARYTIDEWGAAIGASNRTLSRLFQRETGMSFVRWRQQLHVGLALQRLAAGELVTNIAVDLGYESTSAFIAMFRRMLGTTPARYFDDIASGVPDRTEHKPLVEADHSGGHRTNIVPLKRR